MKRKIKWRKLSLKQVSILLLIFFGLFLGLIKIKNKFQNSSNTIAIVENSKSTRTFQVKKNQELELEKRRKEFTAKKLLSNIQVRNYPELNCSNTKTFYNKKWGLTFKYPSRFKVSYGDYSSPTILFDEKEGDQINIGHPSLKNKSLNPDHYYSDSIEDIANREQLYLSYYDLVIKLTLPHKNIYEIRKQQFVSIDLSKSIDEQPPFALRASKSEYYEFNNGKCGVGADYSRLGNIVDEEFLCVINSTKILCD